MTTRNVWILGDHSVRRRPGRPSEGLLSIIAAGAALVDAARPVAGEAIAPALTRRPRTSYVPPLGHTYDAKGEAPVRPAEQRRRDLAPATQRRASLEESRTRVQSPTRHRPSYARVSYHTSAGAGADASQTATWLRDVRYPQRRTRRRANQSTLRLANVEAMSVGLLTDRDVVPRVELGSAPALRSAMLGVLRPRPVRGPVGEAHHGDPFTIGRLEEPLVNEAVQLANELGHLGRHVRVLVLNAPTQPTTKHRDYPHERIVPGTAAHGHPSRRYGRDQRRTP